MNSHEIRGKTLGNSIDESLSLNSLIMMPLLGIVGYGHIGSQLSVLAESMGMKIIYYDVQHIMPLGSSVQMETLKVVLETADFITLHVPATSQTEMMIGEEQLSWMKKGNYLINASRGSVVSIVCFYRVESSSLYIDR
jgi:phosphoglycerate dehydrogenase-like enzyme